MIDNKYTHQKAHSFLHWNREVAKHVTLVAQAQDGLKDAQKKLELAALELRKETRGGELHVICEGALVTVKTSGEVVVTHGVVYSDFELTERKAAK